MKLGRFALGVLLFAGLGISQITAQTGASALIRTDPKVPAGTLATIDGRAMGLEVLDPRLADAIVNLDKAEQVERRRALEEAIGVELFTLEGRARNISVNEVQGVEVRTKLKPATPAEIKKVYDDHMAEFGGATLAASTPQIIAYLKQQKTEQILVALAQRLRTKFPVTLGTDINTSGLSANAVIATIAGKPMLAGPLLETLKPNLFQLRSQVYGAARQGLDQAIYSQLVLAEAERSGKQPEDIIRKEVTERSVPVSEGEVTRYFNDNKAYFTANRVTFEVARNGIADLLQEQERSRLEADLTARLSKTHPVVDFLIEPEAPVIAVSVDDDPSKGDVNAPVTVVMFTDFQCSACAATHPLLKELLKPYGNRVRLVIRDFPLQMHPESVIAAEAANAANAQGKFWQYIEILYTHQDALKPAQLQQYASQVGLNRQKFDLEMSRGAYRNEILHDLDDGNKYGVSGTPGIFINGRRVSDLRPESLQRALDRAFAAAGANNPAVGK
ncbi:MAG: thioredoxin domain-containing protein [Pyrinomonadaceae bacterium]